MLGLAPSKWMNDGSAGTVTLDCVTAADAGAAAASRPSATMAATEGRRRRDDMTAFPQRRRAFWNALVGLAAGRRYPMPMAGARAAAARCRPGPARRSSVLASKVHGARVAFACRLPVT